MARLAAGELGAADRDAMRQGRGVLAGRPISEVALHILRDRFGDPLGPWSPAELGDATAPPGEAGEIVVSGRHVVGGYLGGRGDRELKIRVGSQIWHRTGDAGWLDPQGRLWLLGSCKARVLDGGACRYPLAVEAALSDNPTLSRSTLVRHRDRVLLVVEMREGCGDEALLAIARAVQWAAADEVVAIRRMPLDRRHNAKVDHPRLRQMLDGGRWLKRVPVARTLRAVKAAP
jgi:acyl-CoA synthetase (AMP-forming)/AMP-acid ligase II